MKWKDRRFCVVKLDKRRKLFNNAHLLLHHQHRVKHMLLSSLSRSIFDKKKFVCTQLIVFNPLRHSCLFVHLIQGSRIGYSRASKIPPTWSMPFSLMFKIGKYDKIISLLSFLNNNAALTYLFKICADRETLEDIWVWDPWFHIVLKNSLCILKSIFCLLLLFTLNEFFWKCKFKKSNKVSSKNRFHPI